MRITARLGAVIFMATLVILLSATVAGQAGVLTGATVLSGLAMLVTRRRLSTSSSRRPIRATPATRDVASFPAYRRIEGAVLRSGDSARYFDHAVRPLLRHITAAALADRRRIDLNTDTDAAKTLLGPDLWPLVDPDRPASDDSRAPGVDPATLAQLLDRLEAL